MLIIKLSLDFFVESLLSRNVDFSDSIFTKELDYHQVFPLKQANCFIFENTLVVTFSFRVRQFRLFRLHQLASVFPHCYLSGDILRPVLESFQFAFYIHALSIFLNTFLSRNRINIQFMSNGCLSHPSPSSQVFTAVNTTFLSCVSLKVL